MSEIVLFIMERTFAPHFLLLVNFVTLHFVFLAAGAFLRPRSCSP